MTISTSAKVSIASNILALAAVGFAWWGPAFTPPFAYSTHKMLHILGVIMFGGNLIVGPLWVGFALAEPGRPNLAFAMRSLAQADIWLTTPGVQLSVWNGICLAALVGGVRGQPWIVESILLLLFTSVVSITLVLYWQERMVARAIAGDEPGTYKAMIWWAVWGTAVGVPFSLIFYLMVTKSALGFG